MLADRFVISANVRTPLSCTHRQICSPRNLGQPWASANAQASSSVIARRSGRSPIRHHRSRCWHIDCKTHGRRVLMATQFQDTSEGNGRVGELLHRITDDVKTIAHDEIELVRSEVEKTAKTAAVEAAVILLGGIVALIGVGMLCVTVVVALAPVIASLALRLLIMAIVYLLVGGAVAASVGARLKRDMIPDLKVPAYEAKSTVAGVKAAVTQPEYMQH